MLIFFDDTQILVSPPGEIDHHVGAGGAGGQFGPYFFRMLQNPCQSVGGFQRRENPFGPAQSGKGAQGFRIVGKAVACASCSGPTPG